MITQITPSVSNTKIAVWGSGHGEPAVVFMAGGLCDHRSWMSQLLTLRVNRRLLAFDPRGCGMSEGPGAYDILQQAMWQP
jgi:pimeloyl-ACP methyl ester carboxylesterase